MKKKKKKYVKDTKPRHVCGKCGKVRYEYKMRKLAARESTASSQFNNDQKQWSCREHDQLQIIPTELPKKKKKRLPKKVKKNVKVPPVDKKIASFFKRINPYKKQK